MVFFCGCKYKINENIDSAYEFIYLKTIEASEKSIS